MIAVINFSGETWKSISIHFHLSLHLPGQRQVLVPPLGYFLFKELSKDIRGLAVPNSSWDDQELLEKTCCASFLAVSGHLKLRTKRCFVLKFYDFVRFFRRFLWFCHVFPDFRSFQYLCSGLGVWFHSEKTEWISPDRDEPEVFFLCLPPRSSLKLKQIVL